MTQQYYIGTKGIVPFDDAKMNANAEAAFRRLAEADGLVLGGITYRHMRPGGAPDPLFPGVVDEPMTVAFAHGYERIRP